MIKSSPSCGSPFFLRVSSTGHSQTPYNESPLGVCHTLPPSLRSIPVADDTDKNARPCMFQSLPAINAASDMDIGSVSQGNLLLQLAVLLRWLLRSGVPACDT